jgi:c-di-GMP-binding flagellar brake protein YcgR
MNRRRFARVRARLRFTFTWAEHFELFTTEDLSASGALVARHVPKSPLPPLHTVGECAFNLDGVEIRAEARVVRLSRDGFAVKFNGLPRAVEDRIVGWVFRLEARVLSRRLPV